MQVFTGKFNPVLNTQQEEKQALDFPLNGTQVSKSCYSLGHVQELVQVHSSVGELPEGSLLLLLCVRLEPHTVHTALASCR